MEMLISLAIFAVVAMPMMMMPLQAVDMTTEARNTGSLNYEIAEFFTDFQHDVNMSYAFVDIAQIKANNPSLGLDPAKQLFVAYWDPQERKTIRKGYQFKLIPGTVSHWVMMEANIHASDLLTDMERDDPIWRIQTKTLQGENFYIDGNPRFTYCKAGACGTDSNNQPITALGADGVRIQDNAGTASAEIKGMDGSTPAGQKEQYIPLKFVYRNVSYSTPVKYFRLASLQQDIARKLASCQVLPFPMALREWKVDSTLLRTQQHWIAEKPITIGGVSVQIPVETATDFTGAYSELPLNDMHYNRLDETLLVATSSATSVPSQARGAYIFRFRPGFIDYRAFTMHPSKGETYSDPFPIIIHPGDPAWPEGADMFQFLSVTQDTENNIYVLAKSANTGVYTYWVEKFSPDGEYLSRFILDASVSPANDSALGIAYNPAAPDEVQVLVRLTNGDFRILSYPTAQNTDDKTNVVISAKSPALNAINLGSGLTWSNVKGIEYDPLNNRYLFVFNGAGVGTTDFVQIVSLDAELTDTSVSTLLARSRLVLKVYPPNSETPLTNPVGIAYNPTNNLVYLSTFKTDGSANPSRYFTVLPDEPLNKPR